MSTKPRTAQSQIDRRAAEAYLSSLVKKYASDHARLVASTRRSLRTLLPTAHEIVYDYRKFLVISISPSHKGYEGVFAIRAGPDGVQFYFNRGKDLPDPEKLLKGSASLVRFINLESVSTLKKPAVAALIDEAIARNKVAFAEAGKGAVIIQSAEGKQPKVRSSKNAVSSKKKSG